VYRSQEGQLFINELKICSIIDMYNLYDMSVCEGVVTPCKINMDPIEKEEKYSVEFTSEQRV
jgi:hypothetical protein